LAEVRELAARLPDAQFAVASGRVYPHLGPDIEATAKLLEEFLGEAEGPAGVPPDSGDRRPRNPHVAADLSAREMEVLRLLAAGRSNREIAAELVVSEHTVATHVHHVFQKTGLSNRAEVAAYAVRNGLAD
jgi:DNA-binding NarL/FixJ family response regulator